MSGPSEARSFGQATEVTTPSNAASQPNAVLEGVSCTPVGKCVGVGGYTDSSGRAQAMAATEIGGSFAPAVEVAAPSNAASQPIAQLSGVSCTSPGNCIAVGGYVDSTFSSQAMAVTETAGTWGQGSEVAAPSNAGTSPDARFSAVSCTSAGDCVAVGSYMDGSGNTRAMAATETAGTWAQASEVPAPSNAASNPDARFSAVSCTSAGDCVAVGGYSNSSGSPGMAATETAGTWAQASEVNAPANTTSGGVLSGVSCTSAGNCVAVGGYTDSSGSHGMAATETAGTWGQETEVNAPANASATRGAMLSGVSCTSPGNCVAVGGYFDSSGHVQAMTATETGGSFAPAIEVTAPSNALASTAEFLFPPLLGVSCTSSGKCVAVGAYTDSSSRLQAMAATLRAGHHHRVSSRP